MPLYEYKCKNCGAVSSELRLMSRRNDPLECTECGGEAEVILSQFSAGRRNSTGNSWTPPCDDCGST
jgi:putative FmdB family regulatory protein